MELVLHLWYWQQWITQRMSGTILPLPQYAFMAWCSVKKKHRDNFTFTLTVDNRQFWTKKSKSVDPHKNQE
jgi:hypothetical protein